NKEDCEDNSLKPTSISTALTMLPWKGFSKETVTYEPDSNVRTRNNGQKLILRNFKTSQAMNFFPVKIAATWNQLLENIVSAGIVNTFKNRLDKYWIMNPPVLHITY
ncbi:hypothetical protein FHG87_025198, partial [Trinorchestia longiramus]